MCVGVCVILISVYYNATLMHNRNFALYCMVQVQTSLSSVGSNSNSSRKHETNRLSSSRQRGCPSTNSKSLSTLPTDAGSFTAPRTYTGSLPTFSAPSLTTPSIRGSAYNDVATRSLPTFSGTSVSRPGIRDSTRIDVGAKRLKVEIDLTEDDDDNDDFENDLDTEMMELMARTTEQQNSIHSNISSSDNWRRARDSSGGE